MEKSLYFVVRHFTLNSGSYAGFVEEVSKFAHKKGYKVIILCARIDSKLPKHENLDFAEVIRFNVPLIHIPGLGMNTDYLFLAKGVRSYFNNNPKKDEDIIIANTRAALGVTSQKYILRMGQPAIIFLKNMEIAKDKASILTRTARWVHLNLQHIIEKKCANAASRFIYSSEESRKLSEHLFNVKRPFFIPHSGVKYHEMQEGKKIKINGKVILFVSAGSEKIRKGIIHLEKALPGVFSKHKDATLLHVGEKFEWNVPEWCKKRILSVGKVPWNKMKDYYASSDFTVSCALNEWIPNVIYESMAAGVPVLSSDIEGIEEVITHKKTGYIFKRGEVNSLEKGLNHMLENPSFLIKAGKLIKKKAKQIDYAVFSENLLKFAEDINNNKDANINLLK